MEGNQAAAAATTLASCRTATSSSNVGSTATFSSTGAPHSANFTAVGPPAEWLPTHKQRQHASATAAAATATS